MTKKVNAKKLALKYKLAKMLNASIEADKTLIKDGAEITNSDFCKIQVITCTRLAYSKEAQAILDEYAKKVGITKTVSTYTRIDIDKIPSKIDNKANDILSTIK